MDRAQLNWITHFIWGIADDCLRDVFVRGKYRDVILPMTVLRRRIWNDLREVSGATKRPMKQKKGKAGLGLIVVQPKPTFPLPTSQVSQETSQPSMVFFRQLCVRSWRGSCRLVAIQTGGDRWEQSTAA